ncbi:MAG: hypothetical protein ABUL73_04860 [Alphaproteobacteria bacterium]
MAEPAEKREDISVFDTADYINQMACELSLMARRGGLPELADTLEQAQAQAALVMVKLRRPQN